MRDSINPSLRRQRRCLLVFSISPLFVASGWAQGIATERALEPVTVTATRSPLDPNLPTTTESRTAQQLREQNFVNVEDALRYMPATTIRKRYIGDRNSLIGGRSSSELQAPRGLVYADGYLVSQFLGQFNAPRWNVVAPEELARIDVLYGPFSALYPGNSIGTTVVMTTRQPKQFEASARVQYFTQDFDDAGFSGTYSGHQESAWLGNKNGDWSYTISANRLKNKSQPMQYVTLQTPATAREIAAAGVIPAVTGAVASTDPTGKPWYLAGPIGSAIEDSTQEQVKLKLGYDFTSTLYGEALYTYWHNDSRRSGASILRDAAGNPVYSGVVSIAGTPYNLPANAYSPQNVEEGHGMFGFTLKTRHKTGWNASAVATIYDITTDLTRSATTAPPLALSGGPGTYADNSGTGWKTLDLQSTYTPALGEAHAIALGYHVNRYDLQNRTSATVDWRNAGPANSLSAFAGKTSLQALFAQDTWKISSQWLSTLGVRYEEWKAMEGRRENASAVVPYADRKESAWSPKASLSYMPGGDIVVRASVGKGVRFPTVAELFQGSIVGNVLVNNNPLLQPESSLAKELNVEKGFGWNEIAGTLRASIFEDDIHDTILSQTNTLVFPNITNIQNIDRVRTRGIEFSGNLNDFLLKGLELTGNITFARSVILENTNNPASIGKKWVRVPRVRANLIASYRAGEQWLASVALRHSGRQYNNLDNSDINPNTYGGTSSYTVWDAKARYRINKQLEASFGVNNLFDKKYYVFHPYPGRSLFGELHASF
ncbi:TonB-dependent receptor [Noviherbaspirillum saxi]|uniref:TonB-dependent receptor n=1 Tax=Noviherbaspirillum saxi TaxID=2320863 RepID=A0A3A3FPC2_9BURK|nr:TonB-dependent receptor [Noviherbaspirillum saxi]RJF98032.1 TonB-dependent receptor [Noviherbaspirillum saxi]